MSNLDIKFKRLTSFKRCVLQNFPFIEADFDALTNYGLLCKIVEYLNQVIASQNEVQGVTEEIVTAFNNLYDYVKNYFDNLDVQDEINNKLDQMVEDGTLQEIIGDYLNANAVWGFDVVADMQASTNLVDGSYARTLGYHTKNDGGGALYQIKTSVTSDDIYVVIGDDLYAVLAEAEPSANQFGCYGDGTHDDQALLQNYLNYVMNHNRKGILNAGCVYSVTSIVINNRIKLFGNGATLKAQGSADVLEVNITEHNKKVYITNLLIDGDDKAESGLHIVECRNMEFCEGEIMNVVGYGVKQDAGFELYLHNVDIYNKYQTPVGNNTYGIYVNTTDNIFEDIVIKNIHCGIYVGAGSNYFERIHGWNSHPDVVKGSIFFELNAGAYIKDCYNDTYQYGFKFIRSSRNVILRECVNYPNPDFINQSVLGEGESIYIFYFDDPSYSIMVDNRGMRATKGNQDAPFLYSNIDKDEWQNNQNSVANNPDTASVLGANNMPIGTYYHLTDVDETKWNIQRENILVSDNVVYLNIVAQFLGTTTSTAANVIGKLPFKANFRNSIEGYCSVSNARYMPPVGQGAFYLANSERTVAVTFPDGASATNQFVQISANYIRSYV